MAMNKPYYGILNLIEGPEMTGHQKHCLNANELSACPRARNLTIENPTADLHHSQESRIDLQTDYCYEIAALVQCHMVCCSQMNSPRLWSLIRGGHQCQPLVFELPVS